MTPSHWLQNSLNHLQKAEQIGERTKSLLQYTRKTLQRRDYYANRSCYLLDALKQQNELLGVAVTSVILQIDEKRLELSSLEEELEDSIEQTQGRYDELKRIRVPSSLKECTLYDFISDDMIHVLREKRKTLKVGNGLVSAMDKEHKKLTQLSISLPQEPELESSEIFNTLAEVQEIEVEIATILESLTSHYDQCTKGVAVSNGELELDSKEKEELFSVLEKDDNELPDILTELEDCFQELKLRCDSIKMNTHLYDSLVHKVASMKEIGDVLEWTFHSLENTMAQFTKLSSDIHSKCVESHELCTHYINFQNSYGDFLNEINRRRELQAKMKSIAENAQSSLEMLVQQDQKQRTKFLKCHGDTLPLDLWNKLPQGELLSLKVSYSKLPQI
jgi:autophagy-related protein 17